MHKIFSVLAVLLGLGMAMPALAADCRTEIEAVDRMVAGNADLSAERMTQVQQLLAEAQAQQAQGNEEACMKAVEQAKAAAGTN